MVRHIRFVPWRFGRGHLDDAASERPDVARPSVMLPSENLRCHERDGALQLSLELGRDGGERGHSRGGPKVANLEVMAAGVYKKICTWNTKRKQHYIYVYVVWCYITVHVVYWKQHISRVIFLKTNYMELRSKNHFSTTTIIIISPIHIRIFVCLLSRSTQNKQDDWWYLT